MMKKIYLAVCATLVSFISLNTQAAIVVNCPKLSQLNGKTLSPGQTIDGWQFGYSSNQPLSVPSASYFAKQIISNTPPNYTLRCDYKVQSTNFWFTKRVNSYNCMEATSNTQYFFQC